MTVVVPIVATGPVFDTCRLYVPVPPAGKFPLCDFVSARTGALTATTSVAVYEFVAPPPVATATFCALGAAAAPTLTLSEIGGNDDICELVDGAIAALLVQVTCCPIALQLHPEPLAELYVSPGGSVSTTEVTPAVVEPPTLLTVSVNVPVPPTSKFPAWVFVMTSTGGAVSTTTLRIS